LCSGLHAPDLVDVFVLAAVGQILILQHLSQQQFQPSPYLSFSLPRTATALAFPCKEHSPMLLLLLLPPAGNLPQAT
jgi:hypothetical protein